MTDNVSEKVAAINSTLQYLKEQLPSMMQTIKELSSTSVVHTTLIDVLTKNLERLSKNVDELISIQHKVNSSSDEIETISTSLSKIKDEISLIQKNCDMRKFTCDACIPKPEKKQPLSFIEVLKLSPIIVALITFISTIAWYSIKAKIIELLPELIKHVGK